VPLSNFVPRGFGFVHHSIAILCHESAHPYISIRTFCVAVCGLALPLTAHGGGPQPRPTCADGSKLTQLLSEALGGNTFTLALATLQLGQWQANKNTMRYLELFSRVRNFPLRNHDRARGLQQRAQVRRLPANGVFPLPVTWHTCIMHHVSYTASCIMCRTLHHASCVVHCIMHHVSYTAS
jgi:hypothetical protein